MRFIPPLEFCQPPLLTIPGDGAGGGREGRGGRREGGRGGWGREGRRKFYLRVELIKCIDPNEGEALKRGGRGEGGEGGRREGGREGWGI